MSHRLCWLSVVLFTVSFQTARSQEARWPQFRGPGAQGVAADGIPLPTTFGPDKNVLWQTPLPHGHSSPVIWEDRIYITGGDRKTKKLETLCLDRKSGKVLWRKELVGRINETLDKLNSPASATPATDGQHVIVYFGSYGLVCYDRDGNMKWEKAFAPIPGFFGTASSPVIADGLVLFNTGNQLNFSLLALNVKTGDLVWQKDRSRALSTGLWSTPVVRPYPGGHEVIVLGGETIAGYNLPDGVERWQIPNLPPISQGTPALADGLVCVTLTNPIGDENNIIKLPAFAEALKQHDANKDGKIGVAEIPKSIMMFGRGRADKQGEWGPLHNYARSHDGDKDQALDEQEWENLKNSLSAAGSQLQASVLCFRPDDKGLLSTKDILWRQSKHVPEVPSPLSYDGRAYLVYERLAMLTCRDIKTGKEHYRERLAVRGLCYASPVAGDGKVYIACDRGTLIVLKAGDSFEVLHTVEFDEPITATPALVDGKVYLRTEKQLFAFGNK